MINIILTLITLLTPFLFTKIPYLVILYLIIRDFKYTIFKKYPDGIPNTDFITGEVVRLKLNNEQIIILKYNISKNEISYSDRKNNQGKIDISCIKKDENPSNHRFN